MHQPARNLLLVAATAMLNACAVVTVADAAVKVGATVVGTTVEVAAAGINAVVSDDDEDDSGKQKE